MRANKYTVKVQCLDGRVQRSSNVLARHSLNSEYIIAYEESGGSLKKSSGLDDFRLSHYI